MGKKNLSLFQRLETRGQGQATLDRGLGLGSNVEERFHGLSLLRDLGAYQSACQRLVQTSHPRGGGVLQRTCSGGGRRSRRVEDEDASMFIYLTLRAQHGALSVTARLDARPLERSF